MLINYKVNHMLNWSADLAIGKADRETSSAITDTKLCVPAVTLSTQDSKSYRNNWNQHSKEQSTGINIGQKYQIRHKIII